MTHSDHREREAAPAVIVLPLVCLALLGAVCCGSDPEREVSSGATAAVSPLPAENPPTAVPPPADEELADDADLATIFSKAGELARSGLYDRSLKLYERILEEQPDHPPTLINAARIHFIRGRTGEAITLLKRANELVPGQARTLGYLGMAEAKAGRLDEALIHLEGSQLLAPAQIDVGNGLADVYFRLERYEEAGEAWGLVLKQDPENFEARAGLEQVRQQSQPGEKAEQQP